MLFFKQDVFFAAFLYNIDIALQTNTIEKVLTIAIAYRKKAMKRSRWAIQKISKEIKINNFCLCKKGKTITNGEQ